MSHALVPQPSSKDLRAQSKAAKAHQKEVAKHNKHLDRDHKEWAGRMARARDALAFVINERGTLGGAPIALRSGETFYRAFPVALIEDRTQTSYTGRRRGVSIPVATLGGHAIRYNVGSSAGQVHKTSVPTVIDNGELVVTSHRLTFRGRRQSREHLLSKLISVDWPAEQRLTIAVSNRQKVTEVQYRSDDAFVLQLSVTVVCADADGGRGAIVAELQQAVDELQATEPRPMQ